MPAIDDNPELGLTESVTPGRTITDEQTPGRKYPYVAPGTNGMVDDAHRFNHAMKRVDEDVSALILSQFTGIPAMLLLPQR